MSFFLVMENVCFCPSQQEENVNTTERVFQDRQYQVSGILLLFVNLIFIYLFFFFTFFFVQLDSSICDNILFVLHDVTIHCI